MDRNDRDQLFRDVEGLTPVTVVIWTSGHQTLTWVYTGHLTEEEAWGSAVADTLAACWGANVEDHERESTYQDFAAGTFVRRTEYLR